ncbi:hypothetical protein IMCC14465_11110 [alpha proteobacterium IMCC14465]|uniref:Type II secretion system protein GspE N-terminal domain-containing protein n=1 Tax=alpha proteobacterium IMCC14465 TaxID=1220535 RepID=J9A4L4_9PROT|nr:hypothetical protein IMCC14465_11110 [alpha proteobacterium IMCC14465]
MIGYSKEVADRVLRILQAGGQLEQDQLRDIMNKQNGKSPEVLSSLIHNGFDEEVIQTILSRAYALRRKTVTPETIDKDILKSLPIKFIKKEGILPLAKEGRFLRVGAVDPTKATLGGQIKALTNFNVEFFVIKHKKAGGLSIERVLHINQTLLHGRRNALWCPTAFRKSFHHAVDNF